MDKIILLTSAPLKVFVPAISFAEHIERGEYDKVNSREINENHFPLKEKTERSVEIFFAQVNPEIKKRLTTGELISAITAAGKRIVWNEEFLSLAADYPDLHKESVIVSLYNPLKVSAGADRHLVLTLNNNKKALMLTWVPDWDSSYRFPVAVEIERDVIHC